MHHAKIQMWYRFYTHFPSKGKLIWIVISRFLIRLLISVSSTDRSEQCTVHYCKNKVMVQYQLM